MTPEREEQMFGMLVDLQQEVHLHRQETNARFDKVDARIGAVEQQMREVPGMISEAVEEIETRMLRAFQNWASPHESQQRARGIHPRPSDARR